MTIAVEVSAELCERYRAAGHWSGADPVDAVIAAAGREPARSAVIDETGSISLEEATDQAAWLAGWFQSVGVEPGDVVSIQLPNWREAYVVHLAAGWIGAVVNTLPPLYRSSELLHILAACGSRVLVIPEVHRSREDFTAVAQELRPKVPSIAAVLVVRSSNALPEGFVSFDHAVATSKPVVRRARDANAPAVVAFTSGTESLPKGVIHSRNTINFGLESLTRIFRLEAKDVIWAPSPIGHGTGYVWGVRLAMSLGSTLVLQDRWDAAVAARLIDKHRAVYALAATPFVQELVENVESFPGRYDLASFRIFCCGGAAIPRELVQRTKQAIGAELLACWGMTECFIGSVVSPEDTEETKGCCDGRALPGVELRIVDEDGAVVGPGTEGELCVRGPNVMLGYLPTEGAPIFTAGGWLRTGDAATIDETGRLNLVGRKKDIIIRGGMNISPAEVEAKLIDHHAVHRVSVVGYADERLGERTCAYLVPTGEPPSLADLVAFLRSAGLADYKLPDRLEIVTDLPTNSSGKVLKTELRSRLRETPCVHDRSERLSS
jgi:acyl-CoA synthetase (AMP-forming)/AMP-acid ligase II